LSVKSANVLPYTSKYKEDNVYHVESVFNRGSVIEGSEEVLLNGQDHELFEEFVAHKELLRGSGDVSVVVEDSQA
jgi:hypothetical protein